MATTNRWIRNAEYHEAMAAYPGLDPMERAYHASKAIEYRECYETDLWLEGKEYAMKTTTSQNTERFNTTEFLGMILKEDGYRGHHAWIALCADTLSGRIYGVIPSGFFCSIYGDPA